MYHTARFFLYMFFDTNVIIGIHTSTSTQHFAHTMRYDSKCHRYRGVAGHLATCGPTNKNVFVCLFVFVFEGAITHCFGTSLDRKSEGDTWRQGSVMNENLFISFKISLKFVPKVQNNNISALVQIMACRRPGDKPLCGPMMVSLLTYICVTRPQWVIG